MPAIDEIYNIQLSQTLNHKILECKPVLVTIRLLEVKQWMHIKSPTPQTSGTTTRKKKNRGHINYLQRDIG